MKGWYCNVTQPAVFKPQTISFVDLALDVLVFPDQKKVILDEDEFELLNLPQKLALPARAALETLIKMEFKENLK